MKSSPLYRLLVFTLIGFGPILLIGGVLLVGILLNLAIMSFQVASTPRSDILAFVVYAAVIFVLLITVPAVTFVIFGKTKSWLRGSLVLYGAWLLLALIFIYLFSGALAGASMAVVEGAATPEVTRSAIQQQTVSLTLYCQVLVIPWVLLTSWILTKKTG